jgi:hypothetical protein
MKTVQDIELFIFNIFKQACSSAFYHPSLLRRRSLLRRAGGTNADYPVSSGLFIR